MLNEWNCGALSTSSATSVSSPPDLSISSVTGQCVLFIQLSI
jgi:hypothetical protein